MSRESVSMLAKQVGPETRLRCLLDFSGNVEIDPKISAKLYYKSGENMYKQFNVYYNQASWENAYCIYLKYEKLFLDKIKQHPEYKKIPVDLKAINAAHFRILKPKAEHCKKELFKLYKKDYVCFMEELKASNYYLPSEPSPPESEIPKVNRSTSRDITENMKVDSTLAAPSGLGLENADPKLTSDASFETYRKINEEELRKKILQEERKDISRSSQENTLRKMSACDRIVENTSRRSSHANSAYNEKEKNLNLF